MVVGVLIKLVGEWLPDVLSWLVTELGDTEHEDDCTKWALFDESDDSVVVWTTVVVEDEDPELDEEADASAIIIDGFGSNWFLLILLLLSSNSWFILDDSLKVFDCENKARLNDALLVAIVFMNLIALLFWWWIPFVVNDDVLCLVEE